MKYIKYLLYR